jgi:hypothetical protein
LAGWLWQRIAGSQVVDGLIRIFGGQAVANPIQHVFGLLRVAVGNVDAVGVRVVIKAGAGQAEVVKLGRVALSAAAAAMQGFASSHGGDSLIRLREQKNWLAWA